MIEKKRSVVKTTDDYIRITDLWGLFRPRWHWFAISLALCIGAAMLYLLSTPASYTRTASLLVKEDSKNRNAGPSVSDFSDLGIFRNNTNINNEITTLQSRTLMIEVVRRLHLDEVYSVRDGLKRIELYGTSPYSVSLKSSVGYPVRFDVNVDADGNVLVSDFRTALDDYSDECRGKLGKAIQTPVGKVVVNRTKHFSDLSAGTTVRYTHADLDGITDAYVSRLRAQLSNEEGTIVNLSIDDPSGRKAIDILNTLITVYNEKWVEDKNRISVSTSRFISERLGVIESELGHVDNDISSYKSAHLLPDVAETSKLYMNQSAENARNITMLNSQLSSVQAIRSQFSSRNIDQTVPANSLTDNPALVSQINEYNNKVLERNSLLANSSERNPLVQDAAQQLLAMQTSIIQSIDNHILALRSQMGGIRRQESVATSKLASNPGQAKYLLSVERQQKVKEQLYLYLLEKREENELSQAFTAYNTRVITAPYGSKEPTSPAALPFSLQPFSLVCSYRQLLS